MVSIVLARRGWFTPSFWTKAALVEILRKYYRGVAACFYQVKIENMALFIPVNGPIQNISFHTDVQTTSSGRLELMFHI